MCCARLRESEILTYYKILEGKIFILPSKPIQEENDYGLSSKSFVFETICRISPLIYSCTFQLHKHTA